MYMPGTFSRTGRRLPVLFQVLPGTNCIPYVVWQRFVAESGFIGLGGYGRAATVDRPSAQGEPGIEMLAEGIGPRIPGAGIILRILEVDPQPLAVEGKVADLPGILHLTLKLHHDINHSVGRIDR